LRQLILKACARDMDQRYRDIPALLSDLNPLAEDLGIEAFSPTTRRKRMMSIFLIYEDRHQLALNDLMEAFSNEVEEMGITLKAADFSDI